MIGELQPVKRAGSRRWRVSPAAARIMGYVLALLFAGVLLALPETAAAQTYVDEPGGAATSRDMQAWYLCRALYNGTLTSTPAASAYECRKLDMMQAEERSTQFGFSVASVNATGNRNARWYLLPPRYTHTGAPQVIGGYKVQCTVDLNITSASYASAQFQAFTGAGATYYTSASHSPASSLATGPGSTMPAMGYEFNIEYQSDIQDDLWDWDDPAVTGEISWWARINASTVINGHSSTASATCQIIEIYGGYVWVPVVTPVPTNPYEVVPIAWPSVTPMAPIIFEPISNTIEVGLGTPQPVECRQLLPGLGTISETVAGFDVSVGWSAWELCVEETPVNLEVLGIDFAAYLGLGLGVMALGAVLRYFQRSG